LEMTGRRRGRKKGQEKKKTELAILNQKKMSDRFGTTW